MDEKNCYLERILYETSEVTHRINLGTSPVILSVKLHDAAPPALGLRHDVDVCIWQPYNESDSSWQLKHEGTLFALGYIQVLFLLFLLIVYSLLQHLFVGIKTTKEVYCMYTRFESFCYL